MDLLEKEWYIQAPWGRIAIIAWGNCYDPPVLLCHGLNDSAISYRPLVRVMPKNFYYIGIDLPGNGTSDSFPPGLMFSIYDVIFSVKTVVRHFRWKQFVYIGHSFGAVLGKVYNVCYPNDISKLIEIDAINFLGIEPEGFVEWYKYYFVNFYKNYHKINTPKDSNPKLKREEALASMRKSRPLLTEEQASLVLDRLCEPAGDGLIRYTFDRRNVYVHGIPFSAEHIRRIFTAVKTPILTIAFQESLDKKLFRNTSFLLDKSAYPHGNLRCVTIEGGHDGHISNPERLAPFLELFLTKGLEGLDGKAKL